MEQGKEHRAGVLLPLTALPGPFGIGVLGQEARAFVDLLREGEFTLWQMLPVEHLGTSFSPYKCVSAFAGDPMCIDPRWLLEKGWVTEVELDARCEGMDTYRINYEQVYDKQMILLRAAFARLPDWIRDDVLHFDPFWLDEYALFMAIKEQYNLSPWYEWQDEPLRGHEPQAVEWARRMHRSMIVFYRFVQWVFDSQWKELKSYANEQGVKLIGDIPFYVSEDSVEAWSQREMFAMDARGGFVAVSGAPPDYFNVDGQYWGNPLYDWEYMEHDGYAWWTKRMQSALERNDYVRLDHFRGFESYWRIPAGSETAKEGAWAKGPGIKLFEAMGTALGALPVIAEDLGDISPEVEALLAESGFPGMSVLQFGFMGDARHLPHRYKENCAAYTGTHDNTTLLAWMFEMSAEDRDKALFYCGYDGDWGRGGPNCGICRAWIRMLYLSKARMVIIPVQDLLGYGADTRINIPGSAEGNWRFRVTQEALDQIDLNYYKRLAAITNRDSRSTD